MCVCVCIYIYIYYIYVYIYILSIYIYYIYIYMPIWTPPITHAWNICLKDSKSIPPAMLKYFLHLALLKCSGNTGFPRSNTSH